MNLGLVASNHREIASGHEYDRYFPAPQKSDPYLSYHGSTHDTISYMADIIRSTNDQTQKIAPVLKGKTRNETLKHIFDFVFGHMQYKPDDPRYEELRAPARAWADRQTGVDCDCYSIFIGSILFNLGIPFALRMVKIHHRNYFQHVYVVVPKYGKERDLGNRNSYYVIDPVLDTYNEEHPFTEKYDHFMTPIKFLNGLAGDDAPAPVELFYSDEAAETPQNNVVFFDGIDYYERVHGLGGLGSLNGLNGLGFLRKLWKGVKAAGKVIKRIGKKAVKKVVFKKDGTKRGLFKALSRNKGATNSGTATATPIGTQVPFTATANPAFAASQMAATYNPTVAQQAANSVTPDFMLNMASTLNKDTLTPDSILNIAKSVMPDNTLMKELLEAKAEAKTKGAVNTYEARKLAEDAVKASESEITNNVLAQVDRINAGDKKLQMMGMGLMGVAVVGLLVGTLVHKNRQNAAA